MNQANHEVGFTLIELLVVISIISLLSSVVLSSVSSARKSARDTARAQDFRQFRSAVNQYKTKTGNWPGDSSSNDQVSENCPNVDIYKDLVDGGYLSNMPTDPTESVVACGNIADNANSNDADFYYAWDIYEAEDDRTACFAINNFESSSDAGDLEDLSIVSNYKGGGGSGDLNQNNNDFIYCFDD